MSEPKKECGHKCGGKGKCHKDFKEGAAKTPPASETGEPLAKPKCGKKCGGHKPS